MVRNISLLYAQGNRRATNGDACWSASHRWGWSVVADPAIKAVQDATVPHSCSWNFLPCRICFLRRCWRIDLIRLLNWALLWGATVCHFSARNHSYLYLSIWWNSHSRQVFAIMKIPSLIKWQTPGSTLSRSQPYYVASRRSWNCRERQLRLIPPKSQPLPSSQKRLWSKWQWKSQSLWLGSWVIYRGSVPSNQLFRKRIDWC